jgi:hypothetical protein
MYRKINASLSEGTLDLCNKDAVATDLSKRLVGKPITCCMNGLDGYLKVGPLLM